MKGVPLTTAEAYDTDDTTDEQPPPVWVAASYEEVAEEESFWPVLLCIIVAGFGALLSWQNVCAEQHVCIDHGTCFAVRNESLSCAFRTSITPSAYRMLNFTSQDQALASLQRGVCAPGLRQSIDQYGHLRCVRRRTYPDAMSDEAEATSFEPGMPDHEKHCKRWIDAKSIASGEEKFAFFDEDEVEQDVEDILLAGGSGRLAISDVTKFRAACRSMVVSGAAGAAATIAYEHLVQGLKAFDLTQIPDVFGAIGYLGSHFCDAPATVGLVYDEQSFAIKVGVGTTPSATAIAEALYAVGADRSTRSRASEFADLVNDDATTVPAVNDAETRKVVEGSYKNGWIANQVTSSLRIFFEPTNPPLARLLHAAQIKIADAAPYLHGLAAYCAVSGASTVTGEFGGMHSVEASVHQISGLRPVPSALGRLKGSVIDIDRFSEIKPEHFFNASSTTWSALASHGTSITSATRPSARAVCLRAARVAFPDAFDHVAFDTLVTPTLYGRLQVMAIAIKDAALATMQDSLIGSLYATSSGRSTALAQLQDTHLRIAGAPRTTWAGVDTAFVRPELTSNDGAILILMKQARAVYFDRFARAVRQSSVCQHPPLFDGLTRNAYLLLSTSFSCAMLLPGLLVPPFADERYDDASLYSRVGYVVAHEFLHVTAFTSRWDPAYADYLLHRYDPQTYVEAIADAGAMATIMRIGVVSNATLCAHVSQLWCARVGNRDRVASSHPLSNERGDFACDFLRSHFS
jgi:hypothetical protein